MRKPIAPLARIASIEDIDDPCVGAFRCGEPRLDDWLKSAGRNAAARGECNVHICLDGAGSPSAFFTLSSTSINPIDVSNSSRGGISGPIPAILLGKMGVRQDLQTNTGCGTRVLHHAMKYALKSSRYVSARLLVVDALNDGLVTWYVKRDFTPIPSRPSRLICKMSRVERICASQATGYFVD